MTQRTARFVHFAVAVVAVTGVIYGWMRYFATSDDPLALVNHPLEPTLQSWHLLTAPLLVFAVGVLWRTHVWGKLVSGNRDRRRTGLLLALLFAPMCMTGYALQVTVHETWRSVWVWTHVTTSCAFALIYVAHQLTPAAGTPDPS